MYTLEILEQAKEDLQTAVYWYELQQKHLGIRLFNEVRKAIQKIETNPNLYRKVVKEYRQIKTDIFPFVIVFECIKDKIVVYRIFHTSRNPKEKFISSL